MPGPTCAPSTAPSSAHPTSRPSRLSASRMASSDCSCPAPIRTGQVRHGDVDRVRPGGLHGQLLQPRQGASRGPHPLQRRDPALGDLQQRLHGEGTADQRGGGADPAAAAEVLEGVHVEQGATPRGPFPRGLRRVGGRTARVHDVGGRQCGVPRRHPDLPAVHRYDGHGGLASGELRRLEGPAHLRGQVHGDDLRGTGARTLLVDLEQRRRRRPRRAHRAELLERRRHQLGGGPLGPLVVDVGADHDLQRHHDDAALVGQVRRQAGRRVGDHDDRHGREASAWRRVTARARVLSDPLTSPGRSCRR